MAKSKSKLPANCKRVNNKGTALIICRRPNGQIKSVKKVAK